MHLGLSSHKIRSFRNSEQMLSRNLKLRWFTMKKLRRKIEGVNPEAKDNIIISQETMKTFDCGVGETEKYMRF